MQQVNQNSISTHEQHTSFITAHNQHRKDLKAYAYFKVHDRMLSEDLVQDTFLKTWKYLSRGGNINMMRAFLYHVLNDLIIDEYRKRKAISLDILIENGYEPSSGTDTRATDILDGKAASELIGKLPKRYQKVIEMRYMQNLSIHEIATRTNQSKNTVAVQIHRGLEKLKSIYRQHESQTLSSV